MLYHKIKQSFLFTFLILVLQSSINAQLNFYRYDSYKVLNSSTDTLKNPWTGGFNSVQFSEIDLNLDGIKDLFVFDRTGHRISTFINNGSPNTTSYTHAPEYIPFFPSDLKSWVLLRDYNCDGKMDIFGSIGNAAIAVYKNTSTSSTLSFDYQGKIITDYNPNVAELYVTSIDIPAIDDIDGDGDLDILTFTPYSTVEYHKNLSIENHGTCDSLTFERRNTCWGYFRENASNNSVTLFDTCHALIQVPNPEKKHAGSTLLTLDVDANGTKDLVLGDISFNNLTLLYNSDITPDLTGSNMTSQDVAFPKNHNSTIAVDLALFPAAFYLDINNDNIKDLIVAPNCFNGCKNSTNVWAYENSGANNNPDFNLTTQSFVQEGMIEVGEGALPVFFDYNADGLLDLVIGNHSNYDASNPNGFTAGLSLYENIGTINTPMYKLINTDYAGISSLNLDVNANLPAKRIVPTFGDLDNDGDQDMIIGELTGKLHYFNNTAGAGNAAVYVLQTPDYFGIDVGIGASPVLIDLNRDLLLDLVIGSETGFFTYYENTGTASSPNFVLVTNTLGNIHTKRYQEHTSFSNPQFYDNNGSYELFSGSSKGGIFHYTNIDGNLGGTFTVEDSIYGNISEGKETFIALRETNNDIYPDLIVGNYAGGISFYKGSSITAIEDLKHPFNSFDLLPNPAQNDLTVRLKNRKPINTTLKITDLIGQLILETSLTQQKTTLNVGNLTSGIYLITITSPLKEETRKFVKR